MSVVFISVLYVWHSNLRCVLVHVCMCAAMGASQSACMHTCMGVCVCACVRANLCVCACVCVCVHLGVPLCMHTLAPPHALLVLDFICHPYWTALNTHSQASCKYTTHTTGVSQIHHTHRHLANTPSTQICTCGNYCALMLHS
jgi:hypothetical protein